MTAVGLGASNGRRDPVRTLIVHLRRRRISCPLLALACAAALTVAAAPAGAAPVDGRFDPRFSPSLQQPKEQAPVIRELHTVIRERDAGRTLAIVLAGVALFVASGAAAYSVVVVRRAALS
jgi:hypothetical protein